MAENKRIVMVGIPGVGKTTLLDKLKKLILDRKETVTVVSFGTLMLETAREGGVADRDELRKLPVARQHGLQRAAAERIAAMDSAVVIIDTHAFISSPEGYYPGLPAHVLDIIRPTNFVSVSARPEEIYSRRKEDKTRNRDKNTIDNVKKELDVQSGMVSACAVLTGAPVKLILNAEGRADEAVDKIAGAVGL